MKNLKYIKLVLFLSLTAGILTADNFCINAVNAAQQPISTPQTQVKGIYVKPLTLINSPKTYINRTIVFDAKFDKFSTLGLDYKPAYKSSEDYISFLIKRDDTSFNIPLSELKLFLKRSTAEKYIELKSGDEIKVTGTVFSDALGDTWVDVSDLKITKKAPEEKK